MHRENTHLYSYMNRKKERKKRRMKNKWRDRKRKMIEVSGGEMSPLTPPYPKCASAHICSSSHRCFKICNNMIMDRFDESCAVVVSRMNERKKSTNGRSKGKRLPSPQARLGGPLHDGATSTDWLLSPLRRIKARNSFRVITQFLQQNAKRLD